MAPSRQPPPPPTSQQQPAARRQVVFSPLPPQTHPYAPRARLSPSLAPRQQHQQTRLASLLPSAASPRQPSPGGGATRGILKRTESAEANRVARDVQEGTRVNGRLPRAGSSAGSTLFDGGGGSEDSPAAGSEAGSSTAAGGANESPSSVLTTHLRTIIACGAPSSAADAAELAGDKPVPEDSRFVPVSLPDLVESYAALIARFRALASALPDTSFSSSLLSSAAEPEPDNAIPSPASKSKGKFRASREDDVLASLRSLAPQLAPALARDLGRLFPAAPPPAAESGARGSSPTSSPPALQQGRKRGWSEREVTRRREEAQAAHGAVRLVGVLFADEKLWGCFTDGDLSTLLALLLRILAPPSPPSPTLTADPVRPPAPLPGKRTATFALHALAGATLPERVLEPHADRLVGAFLAPLGGGGRKSPTAPATAGMPAAAEPSVKLKLEALHALGHLLGHAPAAVLPSHRLVLPALLRALLPEGGARGVGVQVAAAKAVGGVVSGGRRWVDAAAARAAAGDDGGAREELRRARKVVEEDVGLTVVKALSAKLARPPPSASASTGGKANTASTVTTTATGTGREDKLVHHLLTAFKASYLAAPGSSTTPSPLWALASWAVVLTLLGRNIQTNVSDLLDFQNVVRLGAGAGEKRKGGAGGGAGAGGMHTLAQKGWDHVLHGIVSQSSRRIAPIPASPSASASTGPDANAADTVAYDLPWILAPKRTALLCTNLQAPFARDVAPALVVLPSGAHGWAERVAGESSAGAALARARLSAVESAARGFVGAVYAFAGAVLGAPSEARVAADEVGEKGRGKRERKGRILVKSTPGTDDHGEIGSSPLSSSSFSSAGTPDADDGLVERRPRKPPLEKTKEVHLTTLMDAVVHPLLAGCVLPVIALDSVKLSGWLVLRSIVPPPSSPSAAVTAPDEGARAWKLDRLLCPGFLDGSIAASDYPSSAAERERVLSTLAHDAQAACVTATELPNWPLAWAARHVAGVLELFRLAVRGVRGLHGVGLEEVGGWVEVLSGGEGEAGEEVKVKVLPKVLAEVWEGICWAVDSLRPDEDDTPSKEYLVALASLADTAAALFLLEPSMYLPPALEGAAPDEALVRYGLLGCLVGSAVEVLGEGAFGRVLGPRETMVLGAGRGGAPTVAGILVTTLISTPLPPPTSTVPSLSRAIRSAFTTVLQQLVDVGLQGSLAFNLLGDLTANLNKLAEQGDDAEQEAVRFALWRMMAEKWIELYPSTETSTITPTSSSAITRPTSVPSSDADLDSAHSMTLRLLTDLLTDPFRRFPVLWTAAAPETVALWGGLLETTVSRALAKGMNPNIAVVEDLAAGLTDVDMVDIPCQASFECLRFIALSVKYPGDHEPTNDARLAARRYMKYFPEGFLELLALALDKSYPTVLHHPEMLSSAVDLLRSTGAFLEGLPVGYVAAAVGALTPALSLWVRDEHKVLKGDSHIKAVADVYELVLMRLATKALTPENNLYHVMPPTSDSLSRFAPLFSACLHARSERFVLAFRALWKGTFDGVAGLRFPSEVEELLKALRELDLGVDAVGLAYSQASAPIEITQTQPALVKSTADSAPDGSLDPSGRSAGESTYDADTSDASLTGAVLEATQPPAAGEGALDVNMDCEDEKAVDRVQVEGVNITEEVGPQETTPEAIDKQLAQPDEEQDNARVAIVEDYSDAVQTEAHGGATPGKKKRRSVSVAPRSAPRFSKRRRLGSDDSVVPATPSQPFPDERSDDADIQDLIEMEAEPAAPANATAAAPAPTPVRKKGATPRRSLTKSGSSGGLVSTVSSWIPRFFGSPAMQAAEEELVDGALDVVASPQKGGALAAREKLERERAPPATRSKAGALRAIQDGPDDIFTPQVDKNPIDLTMESENDEDEDGVVPDSDDQPNRSTEPYDTPGTPKSARRSHRQVERRRLQNELPRPDTSVSLTDPGNGRGPLISAEMIDSDDEENAQTSSVTEVDPPSARMPPGAAPAPEPETPSEDLSAQPSPLAHRLRTFSSSASTAAPPHPLSEVQPPPPPPPSPPVAGAPLLALVQAVAPALGDLRSASNADLVQVQRLLAASMAAVSQEMQDRLLR